MIGWQVIDAYVRAHGLAQRPRTIGQTIGGTHAKGSYHYLGLAVDYGVNDSEADQIAALLRPLATGPGCPLVELFGSDGTSLKDGVPLIPEPAGEAGTDTHAAIRAGVTSLDGYVPASMDVVSPASTSSTSSSLSFFGRASTIVRVLEVIAGAALILMGLVQLQRALRPRMAA